MRDEFSRFNQRKGAAPASKRRTPSNAGYYAGFGAAVLFGAVVGGGIVHLIEQSTDSPPFAPGQAPVTRAAGVRAAEGAQQPQWTSAGSFGSWEVRCRVGNASTCIAVLGISRNESGQRQPLLQWIVGADDKGGLQTVFQTPTGVAVGSGIDVKFGDGAAHHVNYVNCTARQCTAAGPMDEGFVKEIAAVERADLTLYAINGQSLVFGIPVAGFGQALAAMKK